MKDFTNEEQVAFGFAIHDINNGHLNTLWVQRLKREYPEMYEYAIKEAGY